MLCLSLSLSPFWCIRILLRKPHPPVEVPPSLFRIMVSAVLAAYKRNFESNLQTATPNKRPQFFLHVVMVINNRVREAILKNSSIGICKKFIEVHTECIVISNRVIHSALLPLWISFSISKRLLQPYSYSVLVFPKPQPFLPFLQFCQKQRSQTNPWESAVQLHFEATKSAFDIGVPW